jgi:hypothetical protein
LSEIVETKLICETDKGTLLRHPVTLEYKDGRIWFKKSPFALKDEIKAMGGSRWHGFEVPPQKFWSVDDSFRNRFQLHYMMGENVYEWFERPLENQVYTRPLMEHQKHLTDAGLTYHYQIWGAEMGTGKTLSAQEVIERSNTEYWYWVGPKTSLPNIEREFKKWDFDPTCATIEYMTYERLVRIMNEWKEGNPVPNGVIFDESSRCKTPTSQRSLAAFKLAQLIRDKYKWDGYVILMSGTPSPKRPTDWFSQCEIAWPGFLREGSIKALQNRLAFMVQYEFDSTTIWKPMGWRDNVNKCNQCGLLFEEGPHDEEASLCGEEYHEFVPSKNEVVYMFERLKGLVVVKHKKDCMSLPDKRYRTVQCPPSNSLLRVAKTIVDSAPNAMTGLTLLRELSDGFQYRNVDDGTRPCNHCPDSKGVVEEWFNPNDDNRAY